MKKTLAVSALILLTPSLSFGAETCSAEFIGSCKTFAKLPLNLNGAKALRLPVIADDAMIFNALADANAKKHPLAPESDAINARALKTAEQAVRAARDLIIGGTDQHNLTAEQKAILARLDALTLKTFSASTPECKASGKAERSVPEANYEAEKHVLAICPTVANLASGSFLQIIGHELGHAISGCGMAKNLYSVKPKQINECLGTKKERGIAKEIFAGYAMTLVPPISELEPRELKVLKKLERCKVVVSQEQANFSGKPALFAKLSSCLDRKYTASWKDFMKHPERIDEQDPDAEQPDTLPCYGIYDEHFADAFGSRVFGKILETSANAQEMSRVAMMEFASEVCATAGEPNHGGYPTSKDRLMIEMSPANVQKALGCVLPATKVCGTSDFITYPKVAAKPAEDSPAAEKNAN